MFDFSSQTNSKDVPNGIEYMNRTEQNDHTFTENMWALIWDRGSNVKLDWYAIEHPMPRKADLPYTPDPRCPTLVVTWSIAASSPISGNTTSGK